jgi:hypothetical protein
MSGGTFDYKQYNIREIADDIEQIIEHNSYQFPDDIIEEFKTGIDILRKAHVYAQRIDYLVSGDDGEESFRERLKEELDQLAK